MKYNPRDPVKSIFVKAYNFAIALFFHVIDGFKKSSIDLKMKRMETCLKCPHSLNKWFECDICGCPIEDKTSWKSEKCPQNRW